MTFIPRRRRKKAIHAFNPGIRHPQWADAGMGRTRGTLYCGALVKVIDQLGGSEHGIDLSNLLKTGNSERTVLKKGNDRKWQ